MKELPATVTKTMKYGNACYTAIRPEASRGTYEDGAIAALLIVLVGLIPVILLARMGKTGR